MREAEEALRDGDLPGAIDRQAEAMEALRQGMRDFGEALAEEQRQQNDGQQGEDFGRADPNSQRDPLGREPGDSARIGSDRKMLQGEDVYRRAQDLLDEIRRRTGDQSRPEGERDYLRRLLDMF
jgi:Sec-independent protein translocase protein TatA